MPTTESGVSIVICCYNSARRLPPTIAHIAAQEVPAHIPWEVIVVDNASTDDTAAAAQALWPAREGVKFQVVRQPRQGLSYAREMGLEQARYEYVSFVDDDNWICPTWVATVFAIMSDHPEVGACGGGSLPSFESTPPHWIEEYYGWLAVGQQSFSEGDITETRGWLWGAGLTIRRSAWQQIQAAGWSSLLEDRKANSLTSGGDNELCYLLRFLGWRLFYCTDLQLTHFLPSNRLTHEYFTHLAIAKSSTRVIVDAYRETLSPQYDLDKRTYLRRWLAKVRDHLFRLYRHFCDTHLLNDDTGKQLKHDAVAEYLAILKGYIAIGPSNYQKLCQQIETRKNSGKVFQNTSKCLPNSA